MLKREMLKASTAIPFVLCQNVGDVQFTSDEH